MRKGEVVKSVDRPLASFAFVLMVLGPDKEAWASHLGGAKDRFWRKLQKEGLRDGPVDESESPESEE